MSLTIDIPEALRDRVQAIAARSNLTPSQVVADALEHGLSLEWQEHFIAQVEAGLKDADNGDFASDADLSALVNKYRPM
ncbi:transcriptional regulator [Devosia riboflavina]|uniref:Transcriptional regulator n=1 Tax=Devosia riboflavina TaxID=46914 RepID=A0A087LYF9_9HYPH|nr:transcriptional regulator [Devosia riboflavina]KFL29662.1 transcriptional regulator [Devosia riboflavina]